MKEQVRSWRLLKVLELKISTMKGHPITKKEEDQIIELYVNGMQQKDIGDFTGFSYAVVSNVVWTYLTNTYSTKPGTAYFGHSTFYHEGSEMRIGLPFEVSVADLSPDEMEILISQQ